MKPQPPLKKIEAADMPEDIASAWEASMDLRGDATFFEVFANHADLYRWYVGSFYGDVFRGGIVARSYKELLRLRLSTLHEKHLPMYAIAASSLVGIKMGARMSRRAPAHHARQPAFHTLEAVRPTQRKA